MQLFWIKGERQRLPCLVHGQRQESEKGSNLIPGCTRKAVFTAFSKRDAKKTEEKEIKETQEQKEGQKIINTYMQEEEEDHRRPSSLRLARRVGVGDEKRAMLVPSDDRLDRLHRDGAIIKHSIQSMSRLLFSLLDNLTRTAGIGDGLC